MNYLRKTCLASLVAVLCGCALACSGVGTVGGTTSGGTTASLAIAGAPSCSVSGVLACVQMPSTPQGGSSVAIAFTITNTSTGTPAPSLTISSVSFTGPNATDFPFVAAMTSCPVPGGGSVTLQAGQSCTATLTFNPTSSTIGPESASIQVTYQFSNATASSMGTIALMGTELPSGAQVSFSISGNPTTVVAFSTTQLQNSPSAPIALTLTNTGSGTLIFSGAPMITGANAADFSITSAVCGASNLTTNTQVVQGDSCTISLVFTPRMAPPGAETASLIFTDNAPATPPLQSGQSVALTGSGIGAPTVTGVSPAVGVQGTSVPVTISGTNFVSPVTVAVSGSGVTASNVVLVNSTTITATFVISGNATLSPPVRTVSVTSNGVTPTTSFSVNPPAPTLTMVNPNSGTLGTNVNVTLTGTNFMSPVTVNVTQGGMPASGISVTNVVVGGSTMITATLVIAANASPSTAVISVTTVGGTSGGLNFSLMSQPSLISISPNSGTPNSMVNVTLTGSNFSSSATISFSGSGITASNVMFTSSTTITATFTIDVAAPTGGQIVTVTTGGFMTMNNVQFMVNPPAPTLTSIVPASGSQGTAVPVTLMGTNFFSPIQSINLSGGTGVTVSNVMLVSSTQITATLTLSATATSENVSVTTLGGTSGTQSFTVNPPVPTVTAIDINKGVQGTNVMITLTGTNFVVGNTTISFSGMGGITASSVVVNPAMTSLTATFTIAAGATPGAQSIFVTTPGGMSANMNVTFTVQTPLSGNSQALTFANTFVDCAVMPTPLLLPSPCPGAQMIMLTNNSSSTLTSFTVPAVSTGSAEFKVTNGCPGSLAANNSCNISVSFNPTAAGTRNPASDSITISFVFNGNPSSLVISPIQGTTTDWVALTWTGDATDVSFNVYRQNATGSCVTPSTTTYHLIQSNVANVSNAGSYADTSGLSHGLTYCYAVTGVNGGSESPLSSATFAAASIP